MWWLMGVFLVVFHHFVADEDRPISSNNKVAFTHLGPCTSEIGYVLVTKQNIIAPRTMEKNNL